MSKTSAVDNIIVDSAAGSGFSFGFDINPDLLARTTHSSFDDSADNNIEGDNHNDNIVDGNNCCDDYNDDDADSCVSGAGSDTTTTVASSGLASPVHQSINQSGKISFCNCN